MRNTITLTRERNCWAQDGIPLPFTPEAKAGDVKDHVARRNPDARIRIPSAALTFIAPDNDTTRTNVRFVAEKYKTRFNQQAVITAVAECEAAMNCWPFGPVGAYHRAGKGY